MVIDADCEVSAAPVHSVANLELTYAPRDHVAHQVAHEAPDQAFRPVPMDRVDFQSAAQAFSGDWRHLSSVLCIALTTCLGVLTAGCGPEPPNRADSSTNVSDALGGNGQSGFERAFVPRPFEFPADHGPHENFRNEWWYLTGNLESDDGRRFGYQLTFFRIALTPTDPEPDSAWRTRQVYMGHFAVTDAAAGEHRAFERFARGAVGLAGAQAEPFHVWLEDWSLRGTPGTTFPIRLRASADGVSVDLTLRGGPTPVFQGNRGLSQKSTEPGNASYYYSHTRLPTEGVVGIANVRHRVTGSSWLDREWSTSALGPDQTGWDWFALQLDDGRDLMFYRLRSAEGQTDPHSAGILRSADGTVTSLGAPAVRLTALDYWNSARTGDRYPTAWRVEVPSQEIDLEVRAVIEDQEMRLTVHYWEGAVDVTGSTTGKGYLEMTRY